MMPLRIFKGRLRRRTAQYLFEALKWCRANNFERVVVPCAGTFSASGTDVATVMLHVRIEGN